MALIGALAAALAAVASAIAVDGHRIGSRVHLPPILFAAAVVPALVALRMGRLPLATPTARLRRVSSRWPALVLLPPAIGFVVLSGADPKGGGAPTLVAVVALGGLLVAPWWPRPPALVATAGAAGVGLLRPGGSPGDPPLALAVLLVATAVALVAAGQLQAAGQPPLGGAPLTSPPRRTATKTAAVLAVLVLTSLIVALLPSDGGGSQGGANPFGGVDPGENPLLGVGILDPSAAGPGQGSNPNQLLLRIRAPGPDVWRAAILTRFQSGLWGADDLFNDDENPPLRGRPGPLLVLSPDEYEAPAGERFEQQVTAETLAQVAVGAPRLAVVRTDGAYVAGVFGSAVLTPFLRPGDGYTAVSQRHPAAVEALRASDGTAFPPGGERFRAVEGVSARARALAQEVVDSAPTSYDKVQALLGWLAANVEIDDEVAALPDGADPVDDVLFGSRTASGDRLASTFALLLRTLGIPSRVAIGFLPGERSLFGGAFEVRARHRMVWVEVAFPGLGWQRFDPTGRIAASLNADSFWSRLLRFLAAIWPLLALVLALAVFLLVRRLVRRRRLARTATWASLAFARLEKAGARSGRPRTPAETPREYAGALARLDGLADERLHRVGELLTAAAWSGREPADSDRRFAEVVLTDTEAAARRRRRASRRSPFPSK